MTGMVLAHYEIEDLLGEGGSGVVYRGRDLRLERWVAIKILADHLRDDQLGWARLLREARLASNLNHPNIGAIYDLGEEAGRSYIVMEYVEGLSLSDLIPEGGMPPLQVQGYGGQIAEALACAHQAGVIHGDLKGSNILVTCDGNIKLVDFGLGRRIPRSGMADVTSSRLPLAEAGATAGTLPYLAPEVLRGNPTSRQSDLWALGVLLYQMVTGELPFRGGTPFELSMEIMVGTPRKLGQVPEPLRSTLRHCLEKDSAARCAQAREVVESLARNARAHQPLVSAPACAAAPAATITQPGKIARPRNRRKWFAAGGVTALVMLVLVIMLGRQGLILHRPARKASEFKVNKAYGAGNPGVKVWVNTRSGTYHCAGTTWYGDTQEGEYMTQQAAQDKGYRPAANRACL